MKYVKYEYQQSSDYLLCTPHSLVLRPEKVIKVRAKNQIIAREAGRQHPKKRLFIEFFLLDFLYNKRISKYLLLLIFVDVEIKTILSLFNWNCYCTLFAIILCKSLSFNIE